jgi:hypothetical protein
VSVIPSHWTPVHRAEDGEHVGYLSADDEARLLTGARLSPDGRDARDQLVSGGLRALVRRWWCRLPAALPDGVLDARTPQPDWGWRPVVIVEVTPELCTVRPEWPAPGEMTGRALLPTPVGDLLRDEPPGG